MNIDGYILLVSSIAFIGFLGMQPVLFRLIDPSMVLYWLFKSALAIGILGAVVLWFVQPDVTIVTMGLYSMIYGALVVLYVFGWFVIIESSITLRILYEICRGGKTGITREQLRNIYTIDNVLRRRLKRLIVLGEVVYEKDTYRRAGNKSFFSFRDYLAAFNNMIFPAPR